MLAAQRRACGPGMAAVLAPAAATDNRFISPAAAPGRSAFAAGLGGPAPAASGRDASRARAPASVVDLYELVRAKMLAKGGVVGSQDVGEVCSAIDRIPLEELGLNNAAAAAWGLGPSSSSGGGGGGGPAAALLRQRMAQLQASCGSVAATTYLHIHEDGLMTIGIFQLPPGARIPLHNHPGMTVFSRLLYGSLHIRSYDWEGEQEAGGGGGGGAAGALGSPRSSEDEEDAWGRPRRRRASSAAADASDDGCSSSSAGSAQSCASALGAPRPGARAARLVSDCVLSAPTPTSVLFPADGGNIHAFTALSECAILDVLTPPYAPAAGRDCTYYREAFPPALLDAAGRPLLAPSEDVAGWVRWQAARGPAGAAALAAARGGAAAGAGGRHPWQAYGGEGAGLIVGLEAAPMPGDFVVERGEYRGQRVQ
ncbi:hypothetical protein Rsub_05228 [Raphidocelis subcapitata]|uniref:cysteine dioxygenase n=1 Tax=Raphidocelis subcapitata TaxID=307507 RepID=A0A2V0NYA7_9CHLO|nr:hypothetical protein Rsub_05228 [Raphidocelis subcapitata]|eukprot:GBF92614.1 hypothetical protein Rsub_05228 [Raphidocelis subcapitata]